MLYILPSILGLIAGVIGSLVAPWVKWGIEKRRLKFQNHKELVSYWRVLLGDVSVAKAKESSWATPLPFIDRVQGHPYFPSLQPHLSQVTLDLLTNTNGKTGSDDYIQAAYDALLEDVNAAERRWDLI